MKQHSRSAKKKTNAKNSGNPGNVAGGGTSEGEEFGVSASYVSPELNELDTYLQS